MIDAVEAFGDVNFQRILGLKSDLLEDRCDRIPTGASWAKAIGMRGQLGFPGGFQGLAHQRLSRPFTLGWDAEWAFFCTAALRNPRAAERHGLAIETKCCGKRQAFRWGEGFHPIDPRCVFPAIVLGHTSHREQPCIPRLY
jgi:hypothetical protein